MKKRTRIILWLLLLISNDIEINPGPMTQDPNTLQTLQKEMRDVVKIVESQREQISDMTRFHQKIKLEEELLRLTKELEYLKERIFVNGSLVTQNKTVQSAMGLRDLRNMKEELGQNVAAIRNEQQDNREFKKEFLRLSRVFREMTDDQKGMVELLRKDFLALRDFNRSQLLGTNGSIRNLSSESDQHRSLINQTKRVTDSLINKEKSGNETFGNIGGIEDRVSELSMRLDQHSDSLMSNSKDINIINERINSSIQQVMDKTSELFKNIHHNINQNSKDVKESMDNLKLNLTDSKEMTHRNIQMLSEETNTSILDLNNKTSRISQNLCDRMDEIDAMHDDMQDRVFEIDKNRKKQSCILRIKRRREIPINKVIRLWNGPAFRGVKPLLVCFQLFKDKEEILRKSASLLKGTNVYVTEDFSRKIRKQREELLKYARDLRSRDPEIKVNLVYDRLYVESDVYLYNEVEAKVEKVHMKIIQCDARKQATPGSNLNINEFDDPYDEDVKDSETSTSLRRQRLENANKSSLPNDFSKCTERIEIDIFQFPSNHQKGKERFENAVFPSIDSQTSGKATLGSLSRMDSLINGSNPKALLPIINS
ncbi:unnamed protein product [Lepeophtheirus salmonis]|uniref:(salmon louse) hypothetical protein n=1 Tax=Lepeophtheirus salmonis TaxID=72036 RepID=A0A7R8D6M8_LEPSM|nr:unnamed protein product [Lepeophtheirus salmonis]CAF3045689.1 unnamed protein product [Lepeophtheirus salmonis]